MQIEQSTIYAYKLKYLKNPSLDKIRSFARKFINELPQESIDELYENINRGIDQLQTEPEMLVYLFSFGNMHQAKLNYAFEHLPDSFSEQREINIIDYGCGQALGTMCYVDFLKTNNFNQKIKSVTLIEPSEICLKRAGLHTSVFLPNAEIRLINKTFEQLSDDDIVCDENIPTLHILSNVLDLDFDLERLTSLIEKNIKGYNQFVCVGPYFNYSDKDQRMEEFTDLLEGDVSFTNILNQGELNPEKSWTCQALVFSVGGTEIPKFMAGKFVKKQDGSIGTMVAKLKSAALYKSTAEISCGRPYSKLKKGKFVKIQDVCSISTLAANFVDKRLYHSTSGTASGRPYFKLKEAVFGQIRAYVSNAVWEDKKVDKSCYVSLFHNSESEDPNSRILLICNASEAADDEI